MRRGPETKPARSKDTPQQTDQATVLKTDVSNVSELPSRPTNPSTTTDPVVTQADSPAEAEARAARAAATRAKLRAALGLKEPNNSEVKNSICADKEPKVQEVPLDGGSGVDAEAEKAARLAAVKAKMREALLSAAMMEVEKPGVLRAKEKSFHQGNMMVQERPEVGQQGRRLSNPVPPQGRRISGAGESEGKTQNTIWNFFEEARGKKQGTCR